MKKYVNINGKLPPFSVAGWVVIEGGYEALHCGWDAGKLVTEQMIIDLYPEKAPATWQFILTYLLQVLLNCISRAADSFV